MTEDEAIRAAIAAGALQPQGFRESLADNVNSTQNYQNWSDTALARGRLEAWTNAILNGVDPSELKSRVG
jgi:hypothetical protein